MKEFECFIKDYEKIILKLFKIESFNFPYYEIWAYNKEAAPIGHLGFELICSHRNSFLRNVRVCPQYLNRGVGSSMNALFEQFSLQNDCNEISGVYYPTGEGEELAPGFYSRNHYHISEEDDCFLMLNKTIEKEDYNVPQLIESDTLQNIPRTSWEYPVQEK